MKFTPTTDNTKSRHIMISNFWTTSSNCKYQTEKKTKLSPLKQSITLSNMVDDDSWASLRRGSFVWRDWWLPTTTTTRSVLLGVVGESCWEIELCLRLGQTSKIFVIYFSEKVVTLGFRGFYPGIKRSWAFLLFLPRVLTFLPRGSKVLWCSWYSLVTGLVFLPRPGMKVLWCSWYSLVTGLLFLPRVYGIFICGERGGLPTGLW